MWISDWSLEEQTVETGVIILILAVSILQVPRNYLLVWWSMFSGTNDQAVAGQTGTGKGSYSQDGFSALGLIS